LVREQTYLPIAAFDGQGSSFANASFDAVSKPSLNLTPSIWKETLSLYPRPANWCASGHFIAHLWAM
jgi:hypothetical protein